MERPGVRRRHRRNVRECFGPDDSSYSRREWDTARGPSEQGEGVPKKAGPASAMDETDSSYSRPGVIGLMTNKRQPPFGCQQLQPCVRRKRGERRSALLVHVPSCRQGGVRAASAAAALRRWLQLQPAISTKRCRGMPGWGTWTSVEPANLSHHSSSLHLARLICPWAPLAPDLASLRSGGRSSRETGVRNGCVASPK